MAIIGRERSQIFVYAGRATGVSRRALVSVRANWLEECTFVIDGQPVIWRVLGHLAVNEGDEMIVAGQYEGSSLKVLAWWNSSRGVGGQQEMWQRWLGLALLCLGALLVVSAFCGAGEPDWKELFLGIFWAIIGIIAVASGNSVNTARKAVRQRCHSAP